MSDGTRNALSAVRDAAVIVLFVLSGAVWLAYLRFYRELGIVPGDVGIGFPQVLERSAGSLAYGVLIGATILAIVELFAVPVARAGWSEKIAVVRTERGMAQSRPGTWVLGRQSRLVFLLPIVWVAFDGGWIALYAFVLGAVILFPWGIVVDARLGRLLATAAAALSVLSVAALLSRAASTAAASVRAGSPPAIGDIDIGNVKLPILDFRATPARIRLGDEVPRVLYLGSSDGAAVVYDVCLERVRRVPFSRSRVTFARKELPCEEPGTMKPNGSPPSAG